MRSSAASGTRRSSKACTRRSSANRTSRSRRRRIWPTSVRCRRTARLRTSTRTTMGPSPSAQRKPSSALGASAAAVPTEGGLIAELRDMRLELLREQGLMRERMARIEAALGVSAPISLKPEVFKSPSLPPSREPPSRLTHLMARAAPGGLRRHPSDCMTKDARYVHLTADDNGALRRVDRACRKRVVKSDVKDERSDAAEVISTQARGTPRVDVSCIDYQNA